MKILHLYPDFMNLYGEYGNVVLLRRRLERSGAEVTVETAAPGETPDFSDVDFLYMGCGTEHRQKKALECLRPCGEALRAALERGTPALFTGNAWELLGKTITAADGTVHEGLGFLDFTVTETEERFTGDAIARWTEADDPLVGFLNKCSAVTGVAEPLLTMEMGQGNAPGDTGEGVRWHNLLGTHLIGPMLVKNPAVLGRAIQMLGVESDDPTEYERRAWALTLSELRKR